jgi:hypothetical protein
MNYILFALFVILQFLDFWTTYNVITSGKGHEGNPIMAWIFAKIGIIEGFVFIKTVMLIIVGYIVYTVPVNASIFALTIFNVLYAYVVYQNYRILKA